jgi:hypothetical protein
MVSKVLLFARTLAFLALMASTVSLAKLGLALHYLR